MTIPPDLPRPAVLIVCHILSGHLQPMLRIASALHDRGFHVSFLGPTAHRARIEASGAAFLPLTGPANIDDKRYYAEPAVPGYKDLAWQNRAKVDLRLQCLEPLPAQWTCFKAALEATHVRVPARRVVVVAEAFFLGIMPLKYGALLPPGVPTPKTICVSVTIPAMCSIDLPPFGFPFPFDDSPAGRARNQTLRDKWAHSAADLTQLLDKQLLAAGASRGTGQPILTGANYQCHDVIFQLGVPGFEYPLSDRPDSFRYAGLVQGHLPKDAIAQTPPFPWWGELQSNSALAKDHPQRRRVLVVTQGTVEIDPAELIIPTIQAFRERADITVVAILGWKDARLPDSVEVSDNARICDYLSYDAVLEHADVWIHNAGYGAVNHGIAHGVPMVVAGEGMDKPENARRVAWSGIGINLETASPAVDDVRRAVETVLEDGSYKKRTEGLRQQCEELDPFGIISHEIMRLRD